MQHARAPLQRDAVPTQHKRQSAQNHRGGTPTGVLSLWHEANPAARRSTITGYTRAHAEIQVSNEAGVTSFFGALGSAFPLAAVGAVCGVRWEWGKSVSFRQVAKGWCHHLRRRAATSCLAHRVAQW